MADSTSGTAALRAAALTWAAGDVDETMRGQLEQLVVALDAELDATDRGASAVRVAELEELVGSGLTFGTAGLRGQVGPGPNRMNRAVVIRATRGLVDHLLATDATAATRGLVVAFDARHDSSRFARDVAAVAVAAGMVVHRFPTHQPTPMGAFAQKDLDAAACVVVTASHNPPADNGYKVYVEGAAQIVPPTDTAIAAAIAAVGPARDVPRIDDLELDIHPLVRSLGDDVALRYLAAIPAARPQLSAAEAAVPLRIAYTPLHGVGRDMVLRALAEAGYHDVHVAPTQSEPDGDFPTVAFPNPEEPGALDAVLDLARAVDADLVIANDPDGDRLAIAVPDGEGGFVPLSGNRIGVLLAEHCLAGLPTVPEVVAAPMPATPLVISSIVSTPMLASVAAAHAARCEVTLTGFKWICTAARLLEPQGFRLAYGFEEALGSAVGGVVADKDGISAAVAFADLARRTKHQGLTMLDALRALHARHGLWVSHQKSLVHEGAEGSRRIAAAMARLGDVPPTELAGAPVLDVVDFRTGAERRPPWLGVHDLIVLTLEEGRVMIRPSGTEPKCKIYVDVRTGLPDGADAVAERTAAAALAARAAVLADDLASIAGL